MLISAIIITGCFIGSIILMITNKLNRAIAVIAGGIITYFVLTFIEKQDFLIFIDFIFGTSADGYVNLRALILILGMLFIIQICHSAGVFQFIGFKLIQFSKGKPIFLLLILCLLTFIISAILNNILAVIILIPLTIVASRILAIDPSPYIISEAIMVNVGGMFFSISSIPNILITTSANITFIDFFINVGLFSIVIFIMTMLFFQIFYRNKLMIPKGKYTEVLQDFNVWNYVPDKKIFYKSISVLIIVVVCFAAIPPSILSPDIIAMTGGISLIIICKLKGKEIIAKIDLELILYLLGIFIITGAMEFVGVLNLVGEGLSGITGGSTFITLITILWVSAFLSSSIDNIPITKALIPVVNTMTTDLTSLQIKSSYYSLAYGANLGDNLTPLGDNVLVMNIAEQNDSPITFTQFFRLGFIATTLQLIAITIFYLFLSNSYAGILVISFIFLILFLGIFIRYLRQNVKKEEELIFLKALNKIKRQDYRINKKQVVYKIINTIKKILQKFMGIGRKKNGL